MDDQPGLFDLPEQQKPATPPCSARGRARERFARTVVIDLVVRDAAALRAEALRALGRAVPISAVPISAAEGDADADLLDPGEEILASSAAALQWCLEPTNGMWPLLESDAVRIDRVDLATEERHATLVRASWSVTVKIRDAAAAREIALRLCPATDATARAEIKQSFAAAWHWAAEPCAPLAGIPGVAWRCVDVTVEQVLARSR